MLKIFSAAARGGGGAAVYPHHHRHHHIRLMNFDNIQSNKDEVYERQMI